MEEIRIDVKKQTKEELALAAHQAQLIHRFNQVLPCSEEWWALQKEIFKGKTGEGSRIMSPLACVRAHEVTIGKNVIVMNGALMMSAGSTVLPGVTIGKYAIVGAASVVTKDIPDYAVAVGNPARVIKYLDKERFPA